MAELLTHLIAADIGNSRMKFARFELAKSVSATEQRLPEPVDVTSLAPDSLDELAALVNSAPWSNAPVVIGSVQRARTADVIEWLRGRNSAARVRLLTSGDLPLKVDLPHPERTGIDRLLAAVAVNCIRQADRPAAIVDLGTAITVDVVSAKGVFLGGAIAPGLAISAKALHDATDLLPDFDVASLDEHIPAIGRDTTSAIQAGLFLGAVGAIRELIARQMDCLSKNDQHRSYDVFVCGGFGERVAHLLGPDAHYVPHLIPQGIAVAMRERVS